MSACLRPSHYSCYDYIITIINNYHNDYIACPRPQSHQAKNLPGETPQQWGGGRLPTKVIFTFSPLVLFFDIQNKELL